MQKLSDLADPGLKHHAGRQEVIAVMPIMYKQSSVTAHVMSDKPIDFSSKRQNRPMELACSSAAPSLALRCVVRMFNS